MKIISSPISTGILSLSIWITACNGPDSQKNSADKNAIEKGVNHDSERTVSAADVIVPEGYVIEAATKGLSYPVDVTFDDAGNTYIAEAGGHTYGTKPEQAPKARILQLMPDGTTQILYDKVVPLSNIKEHESSADMEEGLIPPVTGVTFYNGKLYISHRSRYSTYDLKTKEFKTIINGLNSWGEFLNAKPIFHNGKMVFFLSTQGNTGILEKHWVSVVDEFNKPKAHEIPGEDITLTGQNYWVPTDKMTIVKKDSLQTGAFAALGEQSKAGQVIKGEKMCNGAFFQCDPDGKNTERLSWGFRSSFGYRYSPDGRLITTMNSANPMPPRGLYFDYEPVYEVVKDEWYGWPDFYSGTPITDSAFEVKKSERNFVLTKETHNKLLKGKSVPRQPLVKMPVHCAAEGMVFGNGSMGVPDNEILVAEFGVIIPFFKGKEFHPDLPEGVPEEPNAPHNAKYNWPGFKVQKVNLQSGAVTDFIYNKNNLPASAKGGGGLERPIQVEWAKDGSLYIVDFGTVEFNDDGMNAHPFTGVLWKVRKK